MREQQHPHEPGISRLLEQHYEEPAMRDAFRRDLRARTRDVVAARARCSPLRRPLGRIVVALGAAACACLLLAGLAGDGVHQVTSALRAHFGRPAVAVRPVERVSLSELLAVTMAIAPVTDASGRPLSLGDYVAASAEVHTGAGGRVTLVTSGGSEFHLGPNSRFSLDANGAGSITRGRLYCCNRSGEVERLDTPAGKIGLLGTVVDAAVTRGDTVAVTVVEGKVRLANAHGEAVVPAGRRSFLKASLAPDAGVPVNTTAETAWYDGRNQILSDYGQIVYTMVRPDIEQQIAGTSTEALAEVWAMNADGTGKRRVKTYLGSPGWASWAPGSQWVQFRTSTARWRIPDTGDPFGPHRPWHAIVEGEQRWLLNVATGQDAALRLPTGYRVLDPVFSPDSRRIAFTGWYRPDPANREQTEHGLWLYDLRTGTIRKLLDGGLKTTPAWSPDGRYLVISSGPGYGTDHHLVTVDTLSGEVQQLEIEGAGASVSPNGAKIAYCGDFRRNTGMWYAGVPTSGSIFVLDRAAGGEPTRVSPEGEGAVQPRWSPDGTRILYHTQHPKPVDRSSKESRRQREDEYAIFTARADGSQVTQLHEGGGSLLATAWAPDGKAVYARTWLGASEAILLIAADGSGRVMDLGGNYDDSILSPAERQQTDAAVSAVHEAISQYGLGKALASEGRLDESWAAFLTAADLFRELPWRYPLVRFSVADTQRYAEAAMKAAPE